MQFLSAVIRDHLMHPNTSVMLVQLVDIVIICPVAIAYSMDRL